MRRIFFYSFLLITTISHAQTFNRTYQKPDYDYAYAVLERTDGNYLVIGSSRSQFSSDYDISLLLTNPFGEIIWEKYLGQKDTLEFGYSIVPTKDDNYLIVGSKNYRPYVIKFNEAGEVLWDKVIKVDYWSQGFSIIESQDSNYFFVIPYNGTTLVALNSQGDSLWSKNYPFAQCPAVIQNFQEEFMLTGKVSSIENYTQIVLLNVNSKGDTIWSKKYGGKGKDEAASLQQLPDEGYLLVGSFEDIYTTDTEDQTYLIRTNAAGKEIWSKKYFLGNPNYLKLCKVNQGYILSTKRYIPSSWGKPDKYYQIISFLDTAGSLIWSKEFASYSDYLGNNITETSDGYFLLTGHVKIPNSTDVILIKLDSYGNTISSLKKNERDFSIKAYPNPASTHLTVSLNSHAPEEILEIKFWNSLGQEIQVPNNFVGSDLIIDLNNLSSGVLFYQVITKNNISHRQKIIVRK